MTESDFQDCKRQCYGLAHSLGANKIEQDYLINELHGIERIYSYSFDETIQHMLAIFYDGVTYGNWPWKVQKIDSETRNR
jgi:hypothetical protein